MKKRTVQKRIKPFIPKDCKEVQKLNGDFIKGDLPFETAKVFVNHVRHCNECMEELRAYFMFYTAVRYLNERDKSEMPQNIETLLHEVEAEANYYRQRNRNLIVAFIAFGLGFAVLLMLVLTGQI